MTTAPIMDDVWLRVAQAQTLIEHLPLAMMTLDANGLIQEWNPAAQKMYGYNWDDICGQPYTKLLPLAKLSEFNIALGKTRRQRKVPRKRTLRKRADGSEFEVDFSIHGLFSAEGELRAVLEVCEDISQRQLLEQQLRRHGGHIQAIVQTVVDGIVSIDVKGIITAVNPSIEKMFGYRGHELIGRNVKVLMPEPYKSEHDTYLNSYLRTGQRKIIGIGREIVAQRKDGSIFPIDLSVSEMGDDERGYVGVLRDITERKEAARALKQLNDELQNKVDELAETLERLTLTQAQLVEAEKMASLGGLVAGVSHEINTPVGVCVTASTYLTSQTQEVRQCFDDDELDAEGLERYFDVVNEAGQILERNLSRAAELIGSFKQVAVDRSSDLQREFVLREFLNELLASLRPQLRHSNVRIKIDCADDLELNSKPGALSQILTNLIQNALIHAFPDKREGLITISAKHHDEQLLLRFTDNGCGMPEEHLKQIFDPFFTTRRGQGGTGLGLSIVYNLVKQGLQGEIRVSSQPQQGTEFVIEFPMRLDDD